MIFLMIPLIDVKNDKKKLNLKISYTYEYYFKWEAVQKCTFNYVESLTHTQTHTCMWKTFALMHITYWNILLPNAINSIYHVPYADYICIFFNDKVKEEI